MRRASTLIACPVMCLLCTVTAAELGAPAATHQAREETRTAVDALLLRAAAYISAYERDLTTVVAEEDYVQRLGAGRGAPSRHLRSDLLVVFDEQYGYVAFRDVFEVDGRPVRDREQRLARLFLKPLGNPFARARRIAEESARYNLNHDRIRINRTINMPFTALKFLRGPNQARSQFRLDERQAAKGGTPGDVALTFAEQGRPPLIDSPDQLPSRGTFWVAPESGRVSESELVTRTGSTTIRIRVTYRPDDTSGIWLPSSMEEQYLISAGARIEGSARYANVRRFTVDTATDIAEP